MKPLSDANFLMLAMKNYDNPTCVDVDEFAEDINRIRYLKRLVNKYLTGESLKTRLILNHLIAFYNVFPIAFATDMLIFKLEKNQLAVIKPFLVFLSYVRHDDIRLRDIDLNWDIFETLREELQEHGTK